VISFRYHLITIMAIFLAIALGIVMGATFIQDPLLHQLQGQTDDLRRDNDNLRTDLARLGAQVAAISAFGEQTLPVLLRGRLTGREVVLVSQQGARARDVQDAREALSDAGARIEAHLTLQPRILATDDRSRRDLAEVLGIDAGSVSSDGELTAAALDALATRLSRGGGSLSDPESDPLLRLLAAGYLTAGDLSAGDAPAVGGAGTVLVVIGGGEGAPAMEMDAVLLPLLRSAVATGVGLAVESTDSEYPFVNLVRSDDDLADRVSTVDDLDLPPGRLALVLAIADLVDGGEVGHYGIDERTRDALMPPLEEPPP
jgi:hypothetical protein